MPLPPSKSQAMKHHTYIRVKLRKAPCRRSFGVLSSLPVLLAVRQALPGKQVVSTCLEEHLASIVSYSKQKCPAAEVQGHNIFITWLARLYNLKRV
jgi:hypothetical protein